MVPCTWFDQLPLFSMTSISPQAGQFTVVMLVPSIQRAGQYPRPCGSLARHSMRPYFFQNSPCVFIRADVYGTPPIDSCRATMWSTPPLTNAFVVRLV